MKKIIFILFIFTGCLTAPDKMESETSSCYDYRFCLYMAARGVQTDCKAEYIKCCKDRDYDSCLKDHPEDFKAFTNCFNTRQ